MPFPTCEEVRSSYLGGLSFEVLYGWLPCHGSLASFCRLCGYEPSDGDSSVRHRSVKCRKFLGECCPNGLPFPTVDELCSAFDSGLDFHELWGVPDRAVLRFCECLGFVPSRQRRLARRSLRMSLRWDTAGYRDRVAAAVRAVRSTEESRSKTSVRSLALWSSPEFRLRRHASHSVACTSSEFRDKCRESSLRFLSRPDVCERISVAVSASWDEGRCREASFSLSERWKDSEFRGRMMASRSRSSGSVDRCRSLYETGRTYLDPDVDYLSEFEACGVRTYRDVATFLGCSYSAVPGILRRLGADLSAFRLLSGVSFLELSFRELLLSVSSDFVHNVCPAGVSRLRCDWYSPLLGVAVEINGSYFHSLGHTRGVSSPFHHRDRTEVFLGADCRLYHYWDWWDPQLFLSVLKSKLGMVDKLHARKLSLTRDFDKKDFFDCNHLDGDVPSCFYLGLKDSSSGVVCAVSFRRHKEGLEIARFATKVGYRVVGGFTRLLKRSLSMMGYSGKLVTYCDRDICPDYRDSVYHKCGFVFEGDTGPRLSYYVTRRVGSYPPHSHVSRHVFQRHKLSALFGEDVPDGVTANEYLISKGVYPLYNSGNWRFTLTV